MFRGKETTPNSDQKLFCPIPSICEKTAANSKLFLIKAAGNGPIEISMTPNYTDNFISRKNILFMFLLYNCAVKFF